MNQRAGLELNYPVWGPEKVVRCRGQIVRNLAVTNVESKLKTFLPYPALRRYYMFAHIGLSERLSCQAGRF